MDQKTGFTHCHTIRGHLILKVLAPTVGQRETPIIAAEAAEAMESLGESSRGRCFVLDLSEVRTLTSMGLGLCVDLKNRADRCTMRPVLFGVRKNLRELLHLMRVDRLYTAADDAASLDRLLA
jgi:anti-anti-sigma regulatory factor